MKSLVTATGKRLLLGNGAVLPDRILLAAPVLPQPKTRDLLVPQQNVRVAVGHTKKNSAWGTTMAANENRELPAMNGVFIDYSSLLSSCTTPKQTLISTKISSLFGMV